jgi:hypothetical protein
VRPTSRRRRAVREVVKGAGRLLCFEVFAIGRPSYCCSGDVDADDGSD